MSPTDNDARLAALLLAIDPAGLKGAIVHGRSPASCEQWTEFLAALLPLDAPMRRVPSNISDDRLLGGLDFAATLSRGKAACDRGLLASANAGSILLSAATTRSTTFAHVARTVDRGYVSVERDGFSELHASAFCTIVSECDDDEPPPAAITDRLAFMVDVRDLKRGTFQNLPSREIVQFAQAQLAGMRTNDACIHALTSGAHKLGIASTRAVLLALACARAHAALMSRGTVSDEDIACAARLVLAPRATVRPDADHEEADADSTSEGDRNQPRATPPENFDAIAEQQNASSANTPDQQSQTAEQSSALTDVVLRAATAALPPGLLAAAAAHQSGASRSAGRSGTASQSGVRGRQIGIRRGEPRGGARLDLVATLRAAIPMQRIRRAARANTTSRVELRRDDFRVKRCATPTTTTTLFVVDASGSAALHRLAEAKGAVELMLAEGYARRDKVALIAFRGTAAELVLPPTHALARARRAVAGMPAGGGTPLATALDVTTNAVLQLRRDTSHVVVVMLTDGRANVARDGKGGRARAEADAADAALRLRALAVDVIWIDTSSRAETLSRSLAEKAGARYLLLPTPDARGLTQIARASHNEIAEHPMAAVLQTRTA